MHQTDGETDSLETLLPALARIAFGPRLRIIEIYGQDCSVEGNEDKSHVYAKC